MEHRMNFLKPTLVALALVSVWGCQEKAAEATPVSIETEQQKQSYSLGASIGSYLKGNLEKQADLGVPLDNAYIVSGLQDSLADKAQMSEEDSNIFNSLVRIIDSEDNTIGSGFIIRKDGYFITCHHLIYNLNSINVEYREDDGR